MTYEEIFNKSKNLILANDIDGLEGHIAVQVNITGEGEGAFYIELKDGKVYVEPYEYYDRDCIFIVSGKNFIKMCITIKDFITYKKWQRGRKEYFRSFFICKPEERMIGYELWIDCYVNCTCHCGWCDHDKKM